MVKRIKMTRLFSATFIAFSICCSGLVTTSTSRSSSTPSSYRPYSRHWSCTTSTSPGLPSCNFDKGFCHNYVSVPLNITNGVSWQWGNETRIDSHLKIVNDWQPREITGIKGHFVYLDVANSSAALGSVARLNGYISDLSVKAVCIEFHFATFSDGKIVPEITVYNALQNGTDIFVGHIKTDTQGQWQVARFFSCVGERSTIVFQSEKLTPKTLVALDHISITKSPLGCLDFEAKTTSAPKTTITTESTTATIATNKSRVIRPELSLVISPNICTESVDTRTEIICSVGYNNKYKEVFLVNVLKDDKKEIAVMRGGSNITLKSNDEAKRFQADGYFDNKNISTIYLKLTLTHLTFEDTGNYTCVVTYLNEDDRLQQDSDSANLVVKRLDFGKNESLETAMRSLIHRMENLESINAKQMQMINDLETKLSHRSSFSAYPSSKMNNRRPLGPSMVIIFDKLTMKQGQGYNEKTGIFTAPTSGLYAFHLSVGTWSRSSNSYSEVVIDVNDVPRVLLRTNNDRNIGHGNQDQNSGSLVVALKPGDTVKVVTVAGTASSEEIIDYLSSFSGYLVQPY